MDIEPRYYVSEISGYPLDRDPRNIRVPSTSFSILDRFTAHREVTTFYADETRGMPDDTRRKLAYAEARRLNEIEALDPV